MMAPAAMRAVLAAGAFAAFAWVAGPVQGRLPPAVAPYTLRYDVESAEETLASLRRLGCEDASWELTCPLEERHYRLFAAAASGDARHQMELAAEMLYGDFIDRETVR